MQMFAAKCSFFRVLFVLFGNVHLCLTDFAVPTKVLGFFKPNACSSKTAASFSVNKFIRSASTHIRSDALLPFVYKNMPEDLISDPLDENTKEMLNGSILVTQDSNLCDRLGSMIGDLTSILVCSGVPTATTLTLVETQPKIYLSRANPTALAHCLYKIIQLTVDDRNSSRALLIHNENHPYRHAITESLIWSIQNGYSHVQDIFGLYSLPSDVTDREIPSYGLLEEQAIFAILDDNVAKDLLCYFFSNNKFSANRTLLFAGLPNKNWLHRHPLNEPEPEDLLNVTCKQVNKQGFCQWQALRTAAEGHLLLEYPPPSWNNSDEEPTEVTDVKSELRQVLQNNNCSLALLEYGEALLVYDSVKAILKAVQKASVEEKSGQINGKLVGKFLASTTFNGITGEKISFMEYKRLGGGGYVRNVAHAEITIYRFERGKYVEIAKYFNANNTFTWTQEKSTNGGLNTWKPSQCQEELIKTPMPVSKSNVLMLSVCISLILTIVLLGLVFICFHFLRV